VKKERGNEDTRRTRNWKIELLRLLAIFGIAIFHTFLPFFNNLLSLHASPLSPHLGADFLLGSINILGASGNYIFFMISGFFLIPSAMRKSSSHGYWGVQARAVARRVVIILATVLFYAVIALVISLWIVPISGVSLHQTAWLVSGLEFVWLYLIFTIVTPVIGFIAGKLSGKARVAVVLAVVVVVCLLNAYIAYFSQGASVRSLFDWRKLMSGVTYFMSFLLAGLLGEWMGRHQGHWRRPLRIAAISLIIVCFVPMLVAACKGDFSVMNAMTFKSTSIFSFVIAVAALFLAASSQQESSSGKFATVVIPWLASGILGFYIVQSLFDGVWHPIVSTYMQIMLNHLVGVGSGTASNMQIAYIAEFFVFGLVFSALFVLVVVAFDRIVRRRVLHAVRLD
jgi:peptidoglycan/LPS O-acetylase OafA/YrhL